jgi:DNA invertase Pin-like site-specific DNA recombinase
MTAKFVSYLRVSTARQGASGLGLDAQRKAVADHVGRTGGLLLAEYVEVETGKRADRPKLQAALAQCRATGATLIVAKLDRLARNAAFLLGLRDSGVEFVCCDNPHANRLTIGVLALVAEEEARAISARTKAALAAAKARGRVLGNPNGAAALRRAGRGNTAGVAALRKIADEHAARVAPMVAAIRAEGIASYNGIARALNERGASAPRGGRWTARSVANMLARTPACSSTPAV